MCELLGMSANVPTDIRFSFAALARRGGETGPHVDGWGIAFYEGGRGCRSFHDPEPSARSELAKLLRNYAIKSRVVVAHVRKANRGRVSLENTHPFSRELWGRRWTFAHNGQLRGVKKLPLGGFRPVGSTDSEHAFCWMLGRLQARWRDAPKAEGLERAVAELCAELHGLGVFNMLMTDSRTLYAHCGKRLCYITRRAPFGIATLIDEDWRVDFAQETTERDVVSVVATQALTRDETWTEIPRGRMICLRDGEVRLLPDRARRTAPSREGTDHNVRLSTQGC
ncbi:MULTISPECIES: class II glutamine amidotransferase [Methylobacterium]|uniref:Glutamine amidotransferase YafJ n=3 Tax=Pseudomonadota TaxID=1224 RepID=A0ABQ4SPE1_9HYPH|nr:MULTISPECIES: class II glutamine amidotransferase [Methylobacterium]PIU04382.1 MAG: class II glutamine amidotransferase [Methylobacterium sp. CG09_land_8_20_14_0_10_71_15]PIU13100.1 MAG: class II glutamine amidotransferase [Methylobacterium sp. CG08_land_8_20_14_0_20_71_15]GBU18370.1 type 2 glutamine amidotransferase family protein [Methylobacterium sp.]GJE04947.1 Putative glutamine amidotransferase YafJ [Methylobacterium jeotgali]